MKNRHDHTEIDPHAACSDGHCHENDRRAPEENACGCCPDSATEIHSHHDHHHKTCGCCEHTDISSRKEAPDVHSGPLTISSFLITGLDCADCAAHLEKWIAGLPGIRSVRVNFAAGTMTVEHTVPAGPIIAAVRQAGYSATRREISPARPVAESRWWMDSRTLATIFSGILLATALLLDLRGTSASVVIPLYAGAAVIGGYYAARSGLYGLRALTFDMNVLMTVAVIGAAAIGEWAEAAAVAVLFSVGHTLQAYTMDKTRQSIRTLMDLTPPEARVLQGDREQILPVEEIAAGDLIIVKPGERIAMDGNVKSGSSAVDQATITGESMPAEKKPGDPVYAGTVNGNGALTIEVTRVIADSTLAKIMQMVEEAQEQKAPSQQVVERFARYYTPAVLLIAAGIMVVPWLFFGQEFAPWFYRGLVLLVISCPCALVISTPVSIVAAIGSSSRNGVLIKGGAYLERMGGIQAVAFDKTGTLTHGNPVVTDINPLGNRSEQDLICLAASVEKLSEHPLAAAIVRRAEGMPLQPVAGFTALTGRGARAEIGGEIIYAGNIRLFEELGVDLVQVRDSITALETQGKTVMIIGSSADIFGFIAVADTLRENSKAAVVSLRGAGIRHVTMLTGDNSRVAAAQSGILGLDSYQSDLLPQDKVTTIRKLAKKYGSVAMVGEGVNDAPALAAADVGIAMGAAGSDTALETADIALMSDDLERLTDVVILGRRTIAVIKQNITFAILVKAVVVGLALFGFVDLWMAVLADTGSSILVTLNGMRLMR